MSTLEERVRIAFRSVPYRHYGICRDCGTPAHVARPSKRQPWRCLECFDAWAAKRRRAV